MGPFLVVIQKAQIQVLLERLHGLVEFFPEGLAEELIEDSEVEAFDKPLVRGRPTFVLRAVVLEGGLYGRRGIHRRAGPDYMSISSAVSDLGVELAKGQAVVGAHQGLQIDAPQALEAADIESVLVEAVDLDTRALHGVL